MLSMFGEVDGVGPLGLELVDVAVQTVYRGGPTDHDLSARLG
jgi:hypothetical protein